MWQMNISIPKMGTISVRDLGLKNNKLARSLRVMNSFTLFLILYINQGRKGAEACTCYPCQPKAQIIYANRLLSKKPLTNGKIADRHLHTGASPFYLFPRYIRLSYSTQMQILYQRVHSFAGHMQKIHCCYLLSG